MLGRIIVGVAAAAVIAFAAGLVVGAPHFPELGETADPKFVMLFVVATIAASLLHVGACIIAQRSPPRLFYVLFVAAAARLILLFGAPAPILEGDPERTRFDARLVNRGFNPYEFRPAQLTDEEEAGGLLTGPQLDRLVRARAALTASADAPRPEQVGRPDLRSRATPLFLWFASIADGFKPGSTRGLAFLVLVADVTAIFLLILALRSLRLPLAWVIVYAWSPILLKEAYCSLTADAFLMPALAGLVACIATGRRLLTAVPVALCAGFRFPLLLLAPVFGRRLGLLGLILAGALFAGPFLPFHSPDVPIGRYLEGQVHTWRHFEYNSMLENPVRVGLEQVDAKAEHSLAVAGVDVITPGAPVGPLLAKLLGVVLLLGVVVYLVIRDSAPGAPEAGAQSGLRDLFTVLVVLLVVSPVLQPWHALWLLPVLVVRPSGLAWLLLPTLVSLSYLTHLVGPQAADLTFMGGALSFRVVEYGLFAFLLVLDRIWGAQLFEPPAGAEAAAPLGIGTEEDLEFEYGATLDAYEYEEIY